MAGGLSYDAGGPLGFVFDQTPPTPVFHDLEIYDGRGNHLLAFTVDNVLSEDECARVIADTEKRGYPHRLDQCRFWAPRIDG